MMLVLHPDNLIRRPFFEYPPASSRKREVGGEEKV